MKTLSVLLFCFLFASAYGYDGNEESIKRCAATLKPVIAYVDAFLQQYHRLPTEEEFAMGTSKMGWMLILRDRTNKFAAKQGAKTDLDYMAGVWRGERYYYYKSWDRSFIDAWQEFQ